MPHSHATNDHIFMIQIGSLALQLKALDSSDPEFEAIHNKIYAILDSRDDDDGDAAYLCQFVNQGRWVELGEMARNSYRFICIPLEKPLLQAKIDEIFRELSKDPSYVDLKELAVAGRWHHLIPRLSERLYDKASCVLTLIQILIAAWSSIRAIITVRIRRKMFYLRFCTQDTLM
jgi:hypothetical protein